MRTDAIMGEVRATLAQLDKVKSGKVSMQVETSLVSSNANEEQKWIDLLRHTVTSYDTLKILHHQAEEEYNAAARILIDTAEANRIKLHARIIHYQNKLEQTSAMYTKLKVKLVNERLEYREELEALRLRILSGNMDMEGESFNSDGTTFNPSPNSSTHSDSPSQFSIHTDIMED